MTVLPSIFRLSKEASKLSTHRQYKLGCTILSNGKPISFGHNSYKTCSLTRRYHKSQTIHAEVSALIPLKFRKIKNGTAVIYRETRQGKPALARPCLTCRRILADFGIKTLIYTISGSWAREDNDI